VGPAGLLHAGQKNGCLTLQMLASCSDIFLFVFHSSSSNFVEEKDYMMSQEAFAYEATELFI